MRSYLQNKMWSLLRVLAFLAPFGIGARTVACAPSAEETKADLALAEPIGRLEAVVYDPQSQLVVLLGDGDRSFPRLKPQHLAVALQCVFGPPLGEPQFSLDPAVPTEPDGPWQRAVYVPEAILMGTEFGQALYEADWLLKQYCFGVKVEPGAWLPPDWSKATDCDGVEVWSSGRARKLTKKPREVHLSGFQNLAELRFATKSGADGTIRRARQWIVADDIRLKQTKNGFIFDTVKMAVEAKKQEIGPDGRLRDARSNDPQAKQFARIMTDLYDDLADRESSFAHVKELTKIMAMAKWLRREKVPVDMEWTRRIASEKTDVVTAVSRLSAVYTRHEETPFNRGGRRGVQIQTLQLTLSGGIDLTVRPSYEPSDAAATQLVRLVQHRLSSAAEPTFAIAFGGRTLKAVVAPVTRAGSSLGGSGKLVKRDSPIEHRESGMSVPVARPAPGAATDAVVAFVRRDGSEVRLGSSNRSPQEALRFARKLRLFATGADWNFDAAQEICTVWQRAYGEPDGKRPVLLVHDIASGQDAGLLRAVLARAYPRATIVTTTDPVRAMQNLRKLKPIREGGDANLGACVIRDTLRPGQYETITESSGRRGDWVDFRNVPSYVRRVGPESNTVLVVGDANPALISDLEAAGREGRLKGKAVIIWACGEAALWTTALRLIDDGDAALIWRARGPIPARLVPLLHDALNTVIEKAPATRANDLMRVVIDEAVRRARERGDEVTIRNLEGLRNHDLMSRRERLADFDDVA